VIILAPAGPHFSSGHDLREGGSIAEQMAPSTSWDLVRLRLRRARGRMAREKEIYLGLSERWRNIPKPTSPRCRANASPAG
jgi:enoyl-CoA hydratase